jgi:hypothetical protein
MSIVSIYEELLAAAPKEDLSLVLPKALSLAHEIGNTAFESWLQFEIKGYYENDKDNPIPKYRSVPVIHYDDYNRELRLTHENTLFFNQIPLAQGVKELEGFAKLKDFLVLKDQSRLNILNEALKVNVTYSKILPYSVAGVLEAIRVAFISKLNDIGSTIKSTAINKEEEKAEHQIHPSISHDKITIPWIIGNLEIKTIFYLLGIIFSIFVFGVWIGQFEFAKQILNYTKFKPQQTEISKANVEMQIQSLSKVYDENVSKLQTAIIEIEKEASRPYLTGSDQIKYVESAARLRKDLEKEHELFTKNIEALQKLK